jgi:hypothetical protein
MILLAFSVLDEKATLYAHPFFCAAPGQAVRYFTDWARDKEGPIGKHPEDYKLYRIGSFDDQSGIFLPQNPEPIAYGTEVVNA